MRGSLQGKPRFAVRFGPILAAGLLLAAGVNCRGAAAQAATNAETAAVEPTKPLKDVLPPQKWHRLEESVDRALAWLAAQQNADGSFPTVDQAQPAVTSLCVLAFLSRGHQSGAGPYGQQINRGIDFTLSCQQPDGVFSKLIPEPGNGRSFTVIQRAGGYNHPFAGLMLGEVYGQVTGEREQKVKEAIQKALVYSRALQTRPNKPAGQEGGYRYLNVDSSDLSVTVCELMFLRSARNAEFDVPQQYVDEALSYVRRSADPVAGTFAYQPSALQARGGPFARTITNANGMVITVGNNGASRGVIAAGIVAMSMGGQHQSDIAVAAGNYLLAHPVTTYGEHQGAEHFFYTTYYCSQAAAQLGGRYWEGLFPPMADAFLDAQSADGSWPAEASSGDGAYGNALTTAMAVLTLTTPYQLLPVMQR